jgi:hypothetical protein
LDYIARPCLKETKRKQKFYFELSHLICVGFSLPLIFAMNFSLFFSTLVKIICFHKILSGTKVVSLSGSSLLLKDKYSTENSPELHSTSDIIHGELTLTNVIDRSP